MAAQALMIDGSTWNQADATGTSLEQLVTRYMPLVRRVARHIHRTLPRHIELEDLVSAGVVGLMGAIQKFQQEKATQFSTFAQFRVRGAILDSLRESDWATRDLRRQSREIQAAIASASSKLGHAPDELEIASELGITVKSLHAALTNLNGLEIGSLHEPTADGAEDARIDYLADESEPGALSHCLESEVKAHLVDALDALPERERLVMTLYYYEELTMKEIGQILGIGESRVSQLRSSAVLRLRTAMAVLQ